MESDGADPVASEEVARSSTRPRSCLSEFGRRGSGVEESKSGNFESGNKATKINTVKLALFALGRLSAPSDEAQDAVTGSANLQARSIRL